MNETTITITGNLVDIPELRYTKTGQAVASDQAAAEERGTPGRKLDTIAGWGHFKALAHIT